MERRSLLAMIICILIFLGWQKLIIEPRTQTTTPNVQSISPTAPPSYGQTASEHSSSTTRAQDATMGQQDSQKPRKPAQKLDLATGTGTSVLGDSGPFFLGWDLKNYKLGISSHASAVDMNSVTHQPGEITLAFDDPSLSYLPDAQGNLASRLVSEGQQEVTWNYDDQNIAISRRLSANPNQPYVDIQIKAEFKGKRPKYAFLYLSSQGLEKDPEAQDRQLVYFANQSIERVPLKGSIDQKEILAPVKYVGATNRYFILALIDKSGANPNGLVQPLGQHAGRISLVYPVSGNSLEIPVRVYFGPKELELLRQVDPALDHTVDFGWFTIVAYPLLKILKWIYQFAHNYGLAIIFLTLLLKLATYPLTYKSMKSMKKMAKLQPQLQKIRERYKDDREALNREMLTMMRTHGYNPVAGCLPMIIQMPIFFALYRVLYSSIELYHAPFALWIRDLSSHDPFYVTPVLLAATMFVQQKLTPNTATDPAQARMMQLMPLIFGAFMLALPSGLTLYMLVNAIASIAQQLILNKKLDTAPVR